MKKNIRAVINDTGIVGCRRESDPGKLSVGLIAEDAPEILTGPGHNQILTADAIGMLIAAPRLRGGRLCRPSGSA